MLLKNAVLESGVFEELVSNGRKAVVRIFEREGSCLRREARSKIFLGRVNQLQL